MRRYHIESRIGGKWEPVMVWTGLMVVPLSRPTLREARKERDRRNRGTGRCRVVRVTETREVVR